MFLYSHSYTLFKVPVLGIVREDTVWSFVYFTTFANKTSRLRQDGWSRTGQEGWSRTGQEGQEGQEGRSRTQVRGQMFRHEPPVYEAA